MSDEREDLQALVTLPGWGLFLAQARSEWGGDGYGRRLKLAISEAKKEGRSVEAAIEAVDYANTQINSLLSWPGERIRRIDAEVMLNRSVESLSRGGR